MAQKRTDRSPKAPALQDALPNLIAGLTAIPTGLALQNLVGGLVEKSRYYGFSWPLFCEGTRLFVLIVAFYGLYSTALFLSLDLVKRRAREDDEIWQRDLVVKSVWYIPCTLVLVAAVLLMGDLYSPLQWDRTCQQLALVIVFLTPLSLLLFLGPQVLSPPHLTDEFPYLLPAYALGTVVVFIIAFPLVFFVK